MEEDIMEDIYYLVHKTDKSKLEELRSSKELRPSEYSIEKISKISEITNNKKDYDLEVKDQFPGVYFSLITIDNIDREQLYPGNNVLIFSCKLLKQKNYHINIHDNNGFITETNTYYPWNINDAVDKIASITKKNKNLDREGNIVKTNNEVVFHDPISMKYLCETINAPTSTEIMNLTKKKYDRYVSNPNYFLPKRQIKNNIEPDMSKEPFYCYLQLETSYKEDNTETELDETLSSSDNFLKTIASVCNITDIDTSNEKKDIINKIKANMKYLYSNRKNQNIEALIEFTNKEKEKRIGGSKSKIKSKTKRKVKRKTKRVKKRKRTRTRTIKRKQK